MRKKTDGVTRLLNIGSGLVSACASLLAVVLILYSGYVLYDSAATDISAFSASGDLLKYKPKVLAAADEGPSLAEINPDYRAWITVDGTPIDYPVVQGQDDLYYAAHDANRENSLTGAIYLAAGNSGNLTDSYNLLYGHHMDNGAMFGSLDRFTDSSYFRTHQKATVIGKDGRIWDITFFAVATTDAYEKQIYNVGNRAGEVLAFLTGDRSRDAGVGTKVLIYDSAAAQGGYKIIALSTCVSVDTNGRIVVFGVMKPHEEPAPTSSPTPVPTATPTQHGGTAKNTPTPTPAQPVRLVVHFVEGDKTVFPTEVFTLMPGDPYYVVPPQRPGYDVDIRIVEGIIEEDTVIYVHYTPKYYTLRIRYLFADGTRAAPEYQAVLRYGQEYDVVSPRVPDYKALQLRVSGANKGSHIEHTVIYVPVEWEIGDLPTPLHLESTQMQIGICVE